MAGRGLANPLTRWRVDLARLRRDYRGERTFDRTETTDALALPAARVADDEVRFRLAVDATGNDAVVTGSLSFSWNAECRRCLDSVDGTMKLEIQEIYQPVKVDGETWPIIDSEIDLEPMVRENVLLSLPINAVCSDDCSGPAGAEYTVDLPEDSETELGADEKPADPRWAALDDLKFD